MSGGAGIGATLSRGPACADATVEPIIGVILTPIHARLPGQIPEGPSSAGRRAPVPGDATREGRRSPTRWPTVSDVFTEATT